MRPIPLLLFTLLLLVPLATADTTVDDIPSDLYNYGDKLLLSGETTQPTSLRGILTISLSCNDRTTLIATKLIDITANASSPFSQLIPLTSGQTDRCSAKLTLQDQQGHLLEEKNSQAFVITSDLKGRFEDAKTSYQLGEKLEIKGTLSKYNDIGIDGSAIISFSKANQTVAIEAVEVKLGTISLAKDLSLIPPGHYTVTIEAHDNLGNHRTFTDTYTFDLEGNLDITQRASKSLYKPGETFSLSGDVSSKSGATLGQLQLTLSTDGKQIAQSLASSDMQYQFNIPLSTTIKSGNHDYTLTAKDDNGNIGETAGTYTIQPIPTTLTITPTDNHFKPNDKVSFGTTLLDQAGDPLDETASVLLINPKGETERQKLTKTNTADSIDIPIQAAPGPWKIRLEGFGLTDEEAITIKEHVALKILLEGRDLLVTNTGNVQYKESLAIDTQTGRTSKKLDLDLNETTRINLEKLLDPGNHTLTIPLTGDRFENVNIPDTSFFPSLTGNAIGRLKNPTRKVLLMLGFLALTIALILFLKTGSHTKKQKIRVEEVITRRRKPEIVEEYQKPVEIKKEPPKKEFGIADEKDIEDFRNRMKKMFQEEERKKQRSTYGGDSTPNNQQGNVFDMFK